MDAEVVEPEVKVVAAGGGPEMAGEAAVGAVGEPEIAGEEAVGVAKGGGGIEEPPGGGSVVVVVEGRLDWMERRIGPVGTEDVDDVGAELMGRLEITAVQEGAGFVGGARVMVRGGATLPAVKGVEERTDGEAEEVGVVCLGEEVPEVVEELFRFRVKVCKRSSWAE